MPHHPSRDRVPSRASIPYLVLLAGAIATLGMAFFIDLTVRANDEVRFQGAVEQVRSRIATTADTYVALLRAGAGLFAASTDVALADFKAFANRLDLRDRYPGMQGIGFAMRVAAADLNSLTESLRRQGQSGFAVTPDTPRADYFPIVYLEPLDRRNEAAIGYDMFTEPVRRAAMEQAARAGVPVASGKVTLRQEIDPQPQQQAGFLIYMPVYRNGAPLGTEEQRLAALTGFVYSPLRAGVFLRAALATTEDPRLDIAVYDGAAVDERARLFDTAPPGGLGDARRGRLTAQVHLNISGRDWLLRAVTRPGFQNTAERRLLTWLLVIGSGVSVLLFGLTRREVMARAAAERAAGELAQSERALLASEAELRRMVAAERKAHAEADDANRAKDEFLATLSHELRTPLNAILGWATMMKAGRLDADQQAKALEVIARNARTQAELIEDLLDVSRIITGKLRLDLRPTLLKAAVQAAVDTVRPTADAKGIRLDVCLDSEGIVLGDPDRLQQVAWNLLSNAIKFTPPGGTVRASLGRDGPRVLLAIEDTGIGIDAAFLPYVFERFRQRDSSTTRAHGGVGLGLAIVRHLVELHAGSVVARSEGEGRGATFEVELPAYGAHGPQASDPAGPDAPAELPREALAGVRALVVDDDHDSREVLSRMLGDLGISVLGAASAAEALRLLADERVDVMLADISMPGTDGYSLVRQIRLAPSPIVRSVRAIAVTAHAREEDRQKAEEAGFQLHVAKPVSEEKLQEAIRRVLAAV